MELKIGNRKIGAKYPTFIIAELSANHHHDFTVAKESIRAIKETGADAVKFQTYTPDTITLNCDNEYFRIKQGTIWDGKKLYDLYQEAYMPWEWQPKLKEYAESLGLFCFSTPFDRTAVDFLKKMKVPAYKIASFEITDIPLIEYTALQGKPLLISTGIAALKDIKDAINACRKMGNSKIALLKCTSAYPAPLSEMNLSMIPDLTERFGVVAGISDHSLGLTVPVAAAALGAKIIEKHFILDKKLGGPDAAFSLDLKDFKEMVSEVRKVESAIGKVYYGLADKTRKNREFSRSLFAAKDILPGEVFNADNVRSVRPGYGLHPKYFSRIIGKRARKMIKYGTPLKLAMVSKGE